MPLLPFGSVSGIPGQNGINEFAGWSVISNRSFLNTVGVSASVMKNQTVRAREIATTRVEAIRVIYKNWHSSGGCGEVANPNPIIVTGGVQLLGGGVNGNEVAGDPVYKISFGGLDRFILGRGKMVVSDPIWLGMDRGQVYYIKSGVSVALPAAPSAPTADNSGTGGTLAAGTYTVAVTIAYPGGLESATSAGTSVVISGTQAIAVTSPGAVAGAIGYRVWVSAPGVSSAAYDSGLGIIPFGTNANYAAPYTVSNVQALEWVSPGGTPEFPGSISVSGGSANTASNNGEGLIANADYTAEGRAVPAIDNSTQCYGHAGVLGFTPKGVKKSVGMIGDSIEMAVWDAGYGNLRGGFMMRALAKQFGIAYDKTIVPDRGYFWLGTGGETAQLFAASTGYKRTQIASLATAIHSNYGTNDYQQGGAVTCGKIWAIAQRFSAMGRIFVQSTLLPRTSSTDSWQTIANQNAGRNQLPQFKIINKWIVDKTGELPITNFALLRYPASITPANGATTGGDGTNTTFFPPFLFNYGTETVTVDGVVKTRGVDYTGGLTDTVNGKTVAYAIAFTVAPANGTDVRMTGTKAVGLCYNNPLIRYDDSASVLSCDANGNPAFNGDWWKPMNAILQAPATATSYVNGGLTDTNQSWTTNQWRGYNVAIVSGSSPTNVGEILGITANSATGLILNDSWHPIPASDAQYIICSSNTQDGLHPSTVGHIARAQAVDLGVFN